MCHTFELLTDDEESGQLYELFLWLCLYNLSAFDAIDVVTIWVTNVTFCNNTILLYTHRQLTTIQTSLPH